MSADDEAETLFLQHDFSVPIVLQGRLGVDESVSMFISCASISFSNRQSGRFIRYHKKEASKTVRFLISRSNTRLEGAFGEISV